MSGAGMSHTTVAAAILAGIVLCCIFCLDYYHDRDYFIYHRIKGLNVFKHWCVKRKYSLSCLALLATLLVCVRT